MSNAGAFFKKFLFQIKILKVLAGAGRTLRGKHHPCLIFGDGTRNWWIKVHQSGIIALKIKSLITCSKNYTYRTVRVTTVLWTLSTAPQAALPRPTEARTQGPALRSPRTAKSRSAKKPYY